MDGNVIYLTRERLLELEKELNYMKSQGRVDIAQKIAEARSHGDLSENAEYEAAKEAQGMYELKISKLEATLAKARIVDPSVLPKDAIRIFSKVKIKNLLNNAVVQYELVSPEEADFQQGKISFSSPVGQALMGKKLGMLVKVKAPAGIIDYEILEIDNN